MLKSSSIGLGSFGINMLHEKSRVKYRFFMCATGMCIDTDGMRFSMNFGHKKSLPGNFLEFVGNGIGMPVKSGFKIFEFWVAGNSVAQRTPGKCWVNNTYL